MDQGAQRSKVEAETDASVSSLSEDAAIVASFGQSTRTAEEGEAAMHQSSLDPAEMSQSASFRASADVPPLSRMPPGVKADPRDYK